jgi:hypothetical protein
MAQLYPREPCAFPVSLRLGQAQKRKLARVNLRETNNSKKSFLSKGREQAARMSLPIALLYPRKPFVFPVSLRLGQAQKRNLARVNLRELSY